MHKEIERLKRAGWTVTTSRTNSFRLPAAIAQRHGDTPAVLADILTGVKECVSPDQQSWLLCQPDFAGKTESAFKWNQWELMSIECADGDDELIKDIEAFWDAHLPVYLSVRNGYSYTALRTQKPGAGAIVEGREPEFEEASVVATSYSKFLRTL